MVIVEQQVPGQPTRKFPLDMELAPATALVDNWNKASNFSGRKYRIVREVSQMVEPMRFEELSLASSAPRSDARDERAANEEMAAQVEFEEQLRKRRLSFENVVAQQRDSTTRGAWAVLAVILGAVALTLYPIVHWYLTQGA